MANKARFADHWLTTFVGREYAPGGIVPPTPLPNRLWTALAHYLREAHHTGQ